MRFLRGALLKRPSRDCRCELCVSRVDDPMRIALRAAQIETGHDMVCGTQFRECPECEAAMKRIMTRPVADVKAEVFGCMHGPDMEADDMTREYSDLYFSVVHSGRCDLLNAPCYVKDVALIGDSVWAEAQAELNKEHDRAIKRGLSGPNQA